MLIIISICTHTKKKNQSGNEHRKSKAHKDFCEVANLREQGLSVQSTLKDRHNR